MESSEAEYLKENHNGYEIETTMEKTERGIPKKKSFRQYFGDPIPLGLAAFAGPTLVLNLILTGALPSSISDMIIGPAFFYGGLGQAIASIWCLITGNSYGAINFATYSSLWLSLASLDELQAEDILKFGTNAGKVNGIFLVQYAVMTFILMVGAMGINLVFVVTKLALFLSICLLSAENFRGDSTVPAGVFGCIAGILAWYSCSAFVINNAFECSVLPIFPLSKNWMKKVVQYTPWSPQEWPPRL
eukprot:jgi/Galph1/3072/GphlegSOOS_G1705.1